MIAVGGLRHPAVSQRVDLDASVARPVTRTRIIMPGARFQIGETAAIDGGLHMHVAAEPPVTFDDRIGSVDAVNDDGHPGTTWDHDDRPALGLSCQRRSDQKHGCESRAQRLDSLFSQGNLTERPRPWVKAAGPIAGKPNA